jgi:hypothetical protein
VSTNDGGHAIPKWILMQAHEVQEKMETRQQTPKVMQDLRVLKANHEVREWRKKQHANKWQMSSLMPYNHS